MLVIARTIIIDQKASLSRHSEHKGHVTFRFGWQAYQLPAFFFYTKLCLRYENRPIDQHYQHYYPSDKIISRITIN